VCMSALCTGNYDLYALEGLVSQVNLLCNECIVLCTGNYDLYAMEGLVLYLTTGSRGGHWPSVQGVQ